MHNLNLCFVSGGFHNCSTSWSEDPAHKTNCYKIYSITKGHARILAEDKWYDLEAGYTYFINGFALEKQLCEHFMDVHWVHFIPESQLLIVQLNNLDPVYKWNSSDPKLAAFNFENISLLFENPQENDLRPENTPSLSCVCHFNSALLMLISDMLQSQTTRMSEVKYHVYEKIKTAVSFMNDNYNREISVGDIAKKSFMNPIYFSRLFRQCYKMSPIRYIAILRLNEACKLLRKSGISVREISENVGFCNQFYFAKTFKLHFHMTPTQFRTSKNGP